MSEILEHLDKILAILLALSELLALLPGKKVNSLSQLILVAIKKGMELKKGLKLIEKAKDLTEKEESKEEE